MKDETFITDADGILDLFKNLNNRVKELEAWRQVAVEKNTQDIIRIRELETKVKSLKTIIDIEDVKSEILRHIPYKCPVCEGKGQWFEPPKNEYHCNSCNGMGVVWG